MTAGRSCPSSRKGLSTNHPDSTTTTAPALIRIHPTDDVAVAVRSLETGAVVALDDEELGVNAAIPAGHKVALRALDRGQTVCKYSFPIGLATQPISRGDWVHDHNLTTALVGELADYRFTPEVATPLPTAVTERATFDGYRRASGRVGTRNEVWILNTVGCVNRSAERIAEDTRKLFAGQVDGIHAFGHPFGCSQLGDDLRNTQRILAGLMRHPNAGGVLVLGLGCENNQLDDLLRLGGEVDRRRLRFFNSQDVDDEVETGVGLVGELVAEMATDHRQSCLISELVVGLKCGGSDALSGVTANPLVGRVADRAAAGGGKVVLTEVPEMFGAEKVLMGRAIDHDVFTEVVALINRFKQYYLRHDQPIHENPSPGNRQGGLTTLEEKSLGAIQKGGRVPVSDVLGYGEAVRTPGLSLLEAPGNDAISSTALVASGATVLLFTTGRGTPLGFPVPTIKISSNRIVAEKKRRWIDFDAGAVVDGRASTTDLADQLFAYLLAVASGGELTKNEVEGYREIAIWKSGVTL